MNLFHHFSSFVHRQRGESAAVPYIALRRLPYRTRVVITSSEVLSIVAVAGAMVIQQIDC
jgi:hypothetical protein